MPRSRATIQFAIWRDRDFRALSPTAQLAYFMLVSQRDVSQAGTMPLVPERWARGCTGLPVEHLEAALGELEEARFVYIDDDTEELLIRSLVRNDGIAEQPYVLCSAAREARLTESETLRRVLACELRRIRKAMPADVRDAPEADRKKGRPLAYRTVSETIEQLEDGNPSRTLPEPSRVYPRTLPQTAHENPSSTLREPYEKGTNPSRTLGGGGGGGGVVTSLEVATYGSIPEPDRDSGPETAEKNTPALIHDDGTPTPEGIVREWERASGAPQSDSTRTSMRLAVSQCQRAGHSPETIAAGLGAWAASPITATSQIPAFVDRVAVRPRLAVAGDRPHNSEGWADLARQYEAEEAGR